VRAVLERDFVAEASRPRAFLFRGLLAAAVVAAGVYALVNKRDLLFEAPDEVARAMFGAGGAALLAVLAVLTPAAVVGSILEERQRGTLTLVLAAPIGPRAFALAKMAARGLTMLAWGLAALVPLSVACLMGGVGTGQVLDLVLLAGAVILELSAWATVVSVLSTRIATAVVLAYLAPALRWILCAGVCASMVQPGWFSEGVVPDHSVGRTTALVAGVTTPFPGAMKMADPKEYETRMRDALDGVFLDPGSQYFWRGSGLWVTGRGTISTRSARLMQVGYIGSGSSTWGGMIVITPAVPPPPPPPPPLPPHLRRPALVNLAFGSVVALAALLVAGGRLATEEEPRSSAFQRFLRRRKYVQPPGDRANPVAWKERLLLNTSASRPLYYSAMAVVAGGEALFFVVAQDWFIGDRWKFLQAGLLVATIHAAILGLVGIVSGAACMAYERSVGTLDLLRLSSLGPADIVRGKVSGIVRGLGLLWLLPVLHLVFLASGGYLDPVSALVGASLQVVLVAGWAGIGVLCGMTPPRMETAVRRGVGVYAVMLLGVPFAAAVLGHGDAGSAVRLLWLPTQFRRVMDASLVTFHMEWLMAHAPRMTWPWLEPDHWRGLAGVVAFGLVAAAGVLVAPRLLARRFARESEVG
jgi:ABC-type transport system involved in multi-copper enzyme maturation permease subunit